MRIRLEHSLLVLVCHNFDDFQERLLPEKKKVFFHDLMKNISNLFLLLVYLTKKRILTVLDTKID